MNGFIGGLRIWEPFTYMWLHSTENILHLLFNMLFLWMIGPQLEMVWGSRRFLRFYLQCGIGAGFVILGWNALCSLWNPYAWYDATVGASGAIYGVITAFSLLWPDRTIMLLIPPIPIRAIWFVPLLLAMDTLLGSRNVSVIGHLGGAVVAARFCAGSCARRSTFARCATAGIACACAVVCARCAATSGRSAATTTSGPTDQQGQKVEGSCDVNRRTLPLHSLATFLSDPRDRAIRLANFRPATRSPADVS